MSVKPTLPLILAAVLVPAGLTGESRSRACPPCTGYQDATVDVVRSKLEEAFGLSLTVPDCLTSANLEICERIDDLLGDAGQMLDTIFSGHAPVDGQRCLSCDPHPRLLPLLDGLTTLGDYLETTGYREASRTYTAWREKVVGWRRVQCPCAEPGPTPDPVISRREDEVRVEIIRKCGRPFVRHRRGLKQIFRVPGDRDGCYQSRACRSATEYMGFQTEPGYWSYDGEFWYVWAERQVGDEWVECAPGEG